MGDGGTSFQFIDKPERHHFHASSGRGKEDKATSSISRAASVVAVFLCLRTRLYCKAHLSQPYGIFNEQPHDEDN